MKKVNKVWGKEEWIVNNKHYCFKKLYLKKGFRCSLHSHKKKDETFVIHEGSVQMEHEGNIYNMSEGELIRIRPEEEHRFTGITDAIIHEISTQHIESDSYRKTKSGKVDNV